MKKILYLACFLAIISAIAGGALSYVNSITAPIIKEMGIAAEKENLEIMFPGAEFTEIEYVDETGLVKGAYEATGKGYIYKVETNGYSSTPIIFMIAFDNDGKVVGFTPLQQQETSGFGSRVFEDGYTSQVIGKTSADGFPLLSGATVTSSAVVNGINAAKSVFNEMMGITADPNAPVEEIKPELALGNPVKLSEDFARFDAQVEETGDGVYTVKVKGYGLIDPEGHAGESGTEYARNVFEVTIDKANNKVVSVVNTTFGDTTGFGDKATSEDYLALFTDLDASNLDQDIDTVTGATWTSKSVLAAVQAAINAANQ
ncbi:FMN-binding protein [Anaerorhabdus sp.]|uniref:FMN-binding protein n=1 Tax=Anaerorhabdus sp. TaxID=1872524 RepID=UPI002FCBDAE1